MGREYMGRDTYGEGLYGEGHIWGGRDTDGEGVYGEGGIHGGREGYIWGGSIWGGIDMGRIPMGRIPMGREYMGRYTTYGGNISTGRDTPCGGEGIHGERDTVSSVMSAFSSVQSLLKTTSEESIYMEGIYGEEYRGRERYRDGLYGEGVVLGVYGDEG